MVGMDERFHTKEVRTPISMSGNIPIIAFALTRLSVDSIYHQPKKVLYRVTSFTPQKNQYAIHFWLICSNLL